MTQDKTRIPSHKDMASTRAHCTPNACTPKPRNIYRSSPVSKCSGGMSNGEPLVDHSRNSSFFLDSKKSVCSICHKYIFNTNHDDCITKILNKVNSRAKVQSPKIRNNNPVEPKNHTHKPGRQNGIGQRFSLNKSFRCEIRWQKRIFLHLNLQDEMNRSFIAQNSYRLERETFSKIYRSCRRILSSTFQLIFQEHNFPLGHSLLQQIPSNLTFKFYATHARIVSGPDPEPMKEDQTGSGLSENYMMSLDGTNPETLADGYSLPALPKGS
ncbi:hypothetical protein Tco_1318442 [Tanacetum coccineum]